MKRIVVLTGAGISAESGLSTFRDADGLWEQHPVSRVATHEAWEADPVYVNNFYNMLRKKLMHARPNDGHRLVARLQDHFDVSVITQNVDNLHEMAGSRNVLHLHGELMKTCSSRDPYNPHFITTLTADNAEVAPGQKAGDGSLMRPFIVFFNESVPMIEPAVELAARADIFIVIGSSLVVYPAAGLVSRVKPGTPVYIIDPKPINISRMANVHQIQKGASEGMRELYDILCKDE